MILGPRKHRSSSEARSGTSGGGGAGLQGFDHQRCFLQQELACRDLCPLVHPGCLHVPGSLPLLSEGIPRSHPTWCRPAGGQVRGPAHPHWGVYGPGSVWLKVPEVHIVGSVFCSPQAWSVPVLKPGFFMCKMQHSVLFCLPPSAATEGSFSLRCSRERGAAGRLPPSRVQFRTGPSLKALSSPAWPLWPRGGHVCPMPCSWQSRRQEIPEAGSWLPPLFLSSPYLGDPGATLWALRQL